MSIREFSICATNLTYLNRQRMTSPPTAWNDCPRGGYDTGRSNRDGSKQAKRIQLTSSPLRTQGPYEIRSAELTVGDHTATSCSGTSSSTAEYWLGK